MHPEYAGLEQLRQNVRRDLENSGTFFDKTVSRIRRFHLALSLRRSLREYFPKTYRDELREVTRIAANHIQRTIQARHAGDTEDVDEKVRRDTSDALWIEVYNDANLPDELAIADVEPGVTEMLGDRITIAFTLAKAFETNADPDWQQTIETIKKSFRRLASRTP